MSLTLQDKKYIDTTIHAAINTSLGNFRDELIPFFENLSRENRDHMVALKESFQHEVALLAELIQDRPTRGEVREMISEAIGPTQNRRRGYF